METSFQSILIKERPRDGPWKCRFGCGGRAPLGYVQEGAVVCDPVPGAERARKGHLSLCPGVRLWPREACCGGHREGPPERPSRAVTHGGAGRRAGMGTT